MNEHEALISRLETAKEGSRVIYRDGHSDPEEGAITSFNPRMVFVRYGADLRSQGTNLSDLDWEFPVVMKRATLAEHDGLPLRNAARQAHPCDLSYWRDRGWIAHDLDASCFRLTDTGRERTKQNCGNCAAWRYRRENFGGCYSADRLDGDLSRGPADITHEYEFCEAWVPVDDTADEAKR